MEVEVNTYRIVQARYGWMVQAKVYKTEGVLFWEKTTEIWDFVNAQGKPDSPVNSYPPFQTKEEAKAWLYKTISEC